MPRGRRRRGKYNRYGIRRKMKRMKAKGIHQLKETNLYINTTQTSGTEDIVLWQKSDFSGYGDDNCTLPFAVYMKGKAIAFPSLDIQQLETVKTIEKNVEKTIETPAPREDVIKNITLVLECGLNTFTEIVPSFSNILIPTQSKTYVSYEKTAVEKEGVPGLLTGGIVGRKKDNLHWLRYITYLFENKVKMNNHLDALIDIPKDKYPDWKIYLRVDTGSNISYWLKRIVLFYYTSTGIDKKIKKMRFGKEHRGEIPPKFLDTPEKWDEKVLYYKLRHNFMFSYPQTINQSMAGMTLTPDRIETKFVLPLEGKTYRRMSLEVLNLQWSYNPYLPKYNTLEGKTTEEISAASAKSSEARTFSMQVYMRYGNETKEYLIYNKNKMYIPSQEYNLFTESKMVFNKTIHFPSQSSLQALNNVPKYVPIKGRPPVSTRDLTSDVLSNRQIVLRFVVTDANLDKAFFTCNFNTVVILDIIRHDLLSQ